MTPVWTCADKRRCLRCSLCERNIQICLHTVKIAPCFPLFHYSLVSFPFIVFTVAVRLEKSACFVECNCLPIWQFRFPSSYSRFLMIVLFCLLSPPQIFKSALPVKLLVTCLPLSSRHTHTKNWTDSCQSSYQVPFQSTAFPLNLRAFSFSLHLVTAVHEVSIKKKIAALIQRSCCTALCLWLAVWTCYLSENRNRILSNHIPAKPFTKHKSPLVGREGINTSVLRASTDVWNNRR